MLSLRKVSGSSNLSNILTNVVIVEKLKLCSVSWPVVSLMKKME